MAGPDNHEKQVRLRYAEWPPERILESRSVPPRVSAAELSRARWFWAQRPKGFFLPGFWWVATLLILLMGVSIGSPSPLQEALWLASFSILTFWGVATRVELQRWGRWRCDYARAIARLLSRPDHGPLGASGQTPRGLSTPALPMPAARDPRNEPTEMSEADYAFCREVLERARQLMGEELPNPHEVTMAIEATELRVPRASKLAVKALLKVLGSRKLNVEVSQRDPRSVQRLYDDVARIGQMKGVRP